MADRDTSITMMDNSPTWPGPILYMKWYPPRVEGQIGIRYSDMKFGHMRDEPGPICRIYNDKGEVMEVFENSQAAADAGWFVD